MAFEALYRGYPYNGVKSKELFINRPTITMDDGKVFIECNPEHFPDWTERISRGDIQDFILFRLWDYCNALVTAERQVEDMMAAYPFIPEDFDFEKRESLVNAGTTENKPYYFHKDSGAILMKVGSDDEWVLMDSSGSKINLKLPTNHMAYAVLFSMGIYKNKEETVYAGEGTGMTAEEMEKFNKEDGEKKALEAQQKKEVAGE
jgi:hypothetical protein